jgi:GNAT superfamily N-acetyltransferase
MEEGRPNMSLTIAVPERPTAADHKVLLQALEAYNDRAAGPDPARSLAVLLRDDGQTLGGLWGWTFWRWLFVGMLVVPEKLRGQGWGSRILREAEVRALHRGCTGAWLDSFSFQAPGFYEKQGYRLFGTLEDYPPGHRRCFFEKRLEVQSVQRKRNGAH